MRKPITYGVFLFLAVAGLLAPPASAQWTDSQNGEYVVGQPDWTTWAADVTQQKLNNPASVAVDVTNSKLYVADYANHRILRFSYPISGDYPNAELVFGQSDYTSNAANAGGAVSASTLNNPSGLAVDSTGRLWVADSENHRVVWYNAAHTDSSNKPDADGVLGQADFVSNSANQGSTADQDTVNDPQGVTIDGSGNLFVADYGNNRVLRFDSASGKSNGANADGVLGQADYTTTTAATTQAGMDAPAQCAFYGTTMYVAEVDNSRVLRFDSAASKSNGANADGVLGQANFISNTQATTAAGMYSVWGVACDDSGRLYVCDYNNARVVIFDDAENKADGASADNVLGAPDFTTYSQDTTQNGMYTPSQGAVDNTNDKFIVADYGNNRVAVYAASVSISNHPPVITEGDSVPVTMSEDGSPTPFSLTLNATDEDLDTTTWSIASNPSHGAATGGGPGASKAIAYTPHDDYNGSDSFVVQVSDGNGGTDTCTVNVTVESVDDNPEFVDSTGVTFWFTWGTAGTGNGQFNSPCSMASDSSGNVYVADTNNHRIQKFDRWGSYLLQWGSFGTGDSQFNAPYSIAVDSSDNVYVADTQNDRIQKFDSSGSFLTKWGTTGTADGEMDGPFGLTVDSSDYVYVVDTFNDRIQKFNSTGTFQMKFGSTGTGDGQFNAPDAVAVDDSGNIYVTDSVNDRVQKFNSSGTYLLQWGSTGTGQSEFDEPCGVAVDPLGYVYVADRLNARIQKFDSAGTFVLEWGSFGAAYGTFKGPEDVRIDGTSGTILVADRLNRRIQLFTPDAAGTSVNVTMSEDGSPTAFALRLQARDPDPADTITWSISTPASDGTADVSGTGLAKDISYTPDSDYNGSDSFVVQVSDGSLTDTMTVNVTIESVKDDPTVTAWPTASAIVYGQALSDSTLSGGTASVSGTFTFDSPATTPDVGIYSAAVTFTPDDTANYNTVAGSVNVTVNKATPSVTAWPTASAITYGDALSDSTLSGGTATVAGSFAFDSPATTPDAGTYSAAVTFTPTDTVHYNTVAGSVNVTVNKVTPTVTAWPTASAITYGDALSASTLSGGTASVAGSFGFDAPATTPDAGTYSAAVTFTPTDTTNYETVAGSVNVTVNKATPTVTAWPTASAIAYGDALSDSTLSGGTASVAGSFAFDAPATTPDAGTYSAAVTFTPTDTANYNTASGSVNVTVNKATPTVTAWPTASAITYGDALSDSTLSGGTASVAGSFAFDAPATTPNAGTYSAAVTFTPTDTANYNTVAGSVNVTVSKVTPTVTAWPTASAITYEQALSDSTLSGGTASVAGSFAFDAPATTPDAGTYSAAVTFTPTDTANYNTVAGSVNVTVNKATPSVTAWPGASAITYGQALSASTLSGGSASVAGTFAFDAPATTPDAGTYSAAVTFTPTDSGNYSSVSGGSVNVTVNKATPSVTAWPAASAITYGQALSASTLSGGSASVAGTFAFEAPGTTPNAGTYSASVRFTPTDTPNYMTVLGSVNVTVNKATPSVTAWPTASAITYGQALSASTLSGGTASVAGTFAFDAPGTTPSVGTYSAAVTFTPSDTSNYNTVAGSVDVTVEPTDVALRIVEGPLVTSVTDTAAFVEWRTNNPANSHVTYGETMAMTESMTDPAEVLEHRMTLTGLSADTTYYLQVSSTESAKSGSAQSDVLTFTTLAAADTAAPVILAGPAAANLTETEVLFTWTTDEPATSNLSLDDGGVPVIVIDTELTTDHALHVTGLSAATTYTCVASSVDLAGNGPTESAAFSHTTLAAPDTTAPEITEGPLVVAVYEDGFVVRWLTDEPADSVVEYGTTVAVENSAGTGDLVTEHVVTVAGLAAGATYNYRASSVDASGNGPTASPIFTVETAAAADATAPVITSGPTVIGLTDTTATVYWETNERSDSVVEYGIGSLDLWVADATMVFQHQVTLVDLTPGASYGFRVSSADAAGNVVVSEVTAKQGEDSFQTLSVPDTTAPVIATGPTLVGVSDTSAVIHWTTDELADGFVDYGLSGGALDASAGHIVDSLDHVVVLTGLTPDSAYDYQVSSTDTSDNGPTSSAVLTFSTLAAPDGDAPVFVDGPAAVDVGSTSAAIEWETDEFATTQVYYGTESGNLNLLASTTGLRGDHRLVLANLVAGQTYYYKAVSLDESQNEAQSAEGEFKAAVSYDVNQDGSANAVDIQLVINEALDIDTGFDCDVDGNGSVNAIDIQLVINFVLGLI